MRKFSTFLLFALLGMTQAVAQEYDYLPIAREGVKWVNEKVIVNHGDTTRYYYNYEFCGDDSTWQDMIGSDVCKACYYYTGEVLNVNTDSLIAGLDSRRTITTCGRNEPYSNALFEGRLLLQVARFVGMGGDTFLYVFNDETTASSSSGLFSNTIDYYLICQENTHFPEDSPRLLTRENFLQVEPIEIESIPCRRWAILGEQGDTLALLVEGIGFDSRDMGDLLTPFTRQPDHDADYQEWCGLSHVVKDGQIIYKGMRYREGAFTGLDEAVADRTARPLDENYYDLMGRPVGKEVPSTPGIYIHNSKKIVVR